MNVFGIDYQHTLSIICLRECNTNFSKIHSVSDGISQVIPNTTTEDLLWGSSALKESEEVQRKWKNRPILPLSEQVRDIAFWKGMFRRFYTHIGYLPPIQQNGYSSVVALQGFDFNEQATLLNETCVAAGFEGVKIIPSTRALLSRWLAEGNCPLDKNCTITSVVVGDTSTTVSSYRILKSRDRVTSIIEEYPCLTIADVGQFYWVEKILDIVESSVGEPLPAKLLLKSWSAAIEIGAQLQQKNKSYRVAWSGPMLEKLQNRSLLPSFTTEECIKWPEVAVLLFSLPKIIKEATSLTGQSVPDLILMGGIGSVWPFAKDEVSSIAPMYLSLTPQEDIARGATWWPEFENNLRVISSRSSVNSNTINDVSYYSQTCVSDQMIDMKELSITNDEHLYQTSSTSSNLEDSFSMEIPPWERLDRNDEG